MCKSPWYIGLVISGGGGGGLMLYEGPREGERGQGWAKGESHTAYSLFDVQTKVPATSQTQTLLWSEPDKWSVIWPQGGLMLYKGPREGSGVG